MLDAEKNLTSSGSSCAIIPPSQGYELSPRARDSRKDKVEAPVRLRGGVWLVRSLSTESSRLLPRRRLIQEVNSMLRRHLTTVLLIAMTLALGLIPALASAQQRTRQSTGKSTPPQPEVLTNQSIIKMVKAKVSDDIIIAKIRQSKTRFDLSTDGIVRLKTEGVSDRILSAMMSAPVEAPRSEPLPKNEPPPKSSTVSPTTHTPTPTRTPPRPITRAPATYGLYIEQNGELVQIGRTQTKVQISKWRRFLGGVLPLIRQKIDINIPNAHSATRFDAVRPIFYAYFPPSRDISKFKLLQCKITGQNFNQRTVASASILFSTEQNQDEILCDIGPTQIDERLHRIVPREDLPVGEFAFVEGNTANQSASNIEIIDVFDFGITRQEEKLTLAQYLDTLPPANVTDTSFHSWTKEECQKIAADREGKVDVVGDMLGWFKRQYASLDIYWVDDQLARAFARLEMLDRNLTPEQTNKLASLLMSAAQNQYIVLVSIGQKLGSGRLIGANESARTMRPYNALLTNPKSKEAIVPARRVELMGGYAGLWKVSFDREKVKGPILDSAQEVVFEARLNQNLDLKARFQASKLAPMLAQVR